VIGTPRAYDFEERSEFGPTFLYTLQGGQFVLSLSTQWSATTPTTYLGITDEYVITGATSSASIQQRKS
jgi:hypothetical protein